MWTHYTKELPPLDQTVLFCSPDPAFVQFGTYFGNKTLSGHPIMIPPYQEQFWDACEYWMLPPELPEE